MLIGKEVLGSVVTLFFPIHMRGDEGTLSDTMHGVLTLVGSLFYLLAMGFGATAFGKQFRLYSIATRDDPTANPAYRHNNPSRKGNDALAAEQGRDCDATH